MKLAALLILLDLLLAPFTIPLVQAELRTLATLEQRCATVGSHVALNLSRRLA